MAAPMHDVGKIAIPDAILQKPGKLTSEEFDIMKTHAARGGKIIRETFGHLGDDEYEKWRMKWPDIIMKSGTEEAIRMDFRRRKFHYPRELWR